jgi:hypothetical protein
MDRLASSPSISAIRPNFLYIGTSRAGSSWIYEILREHPEVFVPPAKDIQFFDWNYDMGIDWYLSFFRAGQVKKAIGEVAHDYFLFEEAASRIKQHLPEIRLFCSLREPVSQILSTFLYRKNTTLDKRITFAEFSSQEEIRHLCDYYYNLLPFFQLFPRENLMVLFFDDLKTDPARFARKIYQFLGVDRAFVPASLLRRVLPASEPRHVGLAHLAYRSGSVLRKLGMPDIVGTVKRDTTFQKILSRPIQNKPQVPLEVERALKAYYEERYQNLPELIGQPIPGGWF